MKESGGKTIARDRTHRSYDNGDYLNRKQYMILAVSLFVIHSLFEIWYLWLGCTPMVIINIFSILSYAVSIYVVKKGNTELTIWIMVLEIYLHIVFATIFLGTECGFQLWLFGTVASIFLPFFTPDLSKRQRRHIGNFSVTVIVTFIVLTALDGKNMLPTRYNVDPGLSAGMYYFNAFLGFAAIMLYTGIYNLRILRKNQELQSSADHDYLTGIFNRQRMQKILDAELLREQELDQSKLSVAIADIDFFKKINDTYGHLVGDDALIELVTILSMYEEKGLLYGRWGGEEFLMIAPEDEPYDKFVELLESIRAKVEEHEFVRDGNTIKFTISIGVAAYEKGMTSENLVNLADERLYQAKETGRNKIVYM